MKEYFLLQPKLLARKIEATGINPYAAFVLMLAAFWGGSVYLFEKFEFASYIFIAISLIPLMPLSGIRRNDFLKFHFTNSYYKVRLTENILVSLPFIVFLLTKTLLFPAFINLFLSASFVLIRSGGNFNFVIPTPFSKKPFEFSAGFRKGFVFILIAWLLCLAGVIVSNFNVGIFSIILLFIISLSFYTEPENEYYVWSYILTPGQFLLLKIKTALINSSILISPVVIALVSFFSGNIYIILAFILTGYFVLATVIVAKYSAYPEKMSIPQGILLILSIQLPPLLLAAFPYFYVQAINKLRPFLQ